MQISRKIKITTISKEKQPNFSNHISSILYHLPPIRYLLPAIRYTLPPIRYPLSPIRYIFHPGQIKSTKFPPKKTLFASPNQYELRNLQTKLATCPISRNLPPILAHLLFCRGQYSIRVSSLGHFLRIVLKFNLFFGIIPTC